MLPIVHYHAVKDFAVEFIVVVEAVYDLPYGVADFLKDGIFLFIHFPLRFGAFHHLPEFTNLVVALFALCHEFFHVN